MDPLHSSTNKATNGLDAVGRQLLATSPITEMAPLQFSPSALRNSPGSPSVITKCSQEFFVPGQGMVFLADYVIWLESTAHRTFTTFGDDSNHR